MDAQPRSFGIARRRLERAVERLFAMAGRELAGKGRRARAPASLIRHRQGLCVFACRPDVPMAGNLIERLQRRAVIGRKLSFGAGSTGDAAHERHPHPHMAR